MMKLLLTNDDGIDAPGLRALYQAASALGEPLVIAPAQHPGPGIFWNVNLPHLEPGAGPPEVVYCEVDPAPLPLSFRLEGELFHYDGDYHQRRRAPGSDVDVCFSGKIAVSRVVLFHV